MIVDMAIAEHHAVPWLVSRADQGRSWRVSTTHQTVVWEFGSPFTIDCCSWLTLDTLNTLGGGRKMVGCSRIHSSFFSVAEPYCATMNEKMKYVFTLVKIGVFADPHFC
jgi:hypothetical protein